MDDGAVKRVRALKERQAKKPFSVIAPSKAWVERNCVLSSEAKKFLREKLPGPFTLVLEMRGQCVAKSVSCAPGSLGVRIPRHWFSRVVAKAGVPFVTTSANLAGGKNASGLSDLPESVLQGVDVVVFEGVKKGKPSRVLDFSCGEARRLR